MFVLFPYSVNQGCNPFTLIAYTLTSRRYTKQRISDVQGLSQYTTAISAINEGSKLAARGSFEYLATLECVMFLKLMILYDSRRR